MNAFYLMLIAVSLAAGPSQAGPTNLEPPILAAGNTAGDPYIEITDLSPVPAQAMLKPSSPPNRIIHATPRVDRGVEVASAQFDIAPIGMTSPLLGSRTTSAPLSTATLMPPSSSRTMQPVEPAATRPYISPSAPVARTYVGPPTTIAPAGTTVYPAPLPARTIVTGPAPTVTLMPVVPVSGMKYGRGIIGQPKLYIDGQPVRNFFRWLSP
jgi:hypothetical protein